MNKAPVKSLPTTQRPRERLIRMGAHNLSTSELLAVIMGTGNKKQSVLTAAHAISALLDEPDSPPITPTHQQLQPLVGPIQAGKILAAIELGKRLSTQPQLRTVTKPQDVFQEAEYIRHSHREHMVGLYLNARHELLKKITLTIGSVNSNAVEPRDVFAPALVLPCRSIILIHNHPSGTITPSDEDMAATKRLQQAGELLGVLIVDHVIVTSTSYFSFHQQKLLSTLD